MRRILSLVMVMVGLVSLSAAAQTSTNAQPTMVETAKEITQTNFNQVLVEMLAGVKNASGEIYQASKEMVVKGVDFVMEQVPDVVRQFLRWKFFEAAVGATIGILIAGFIFYWAYRCAKYACGAAKTKEYSDLMTNSQWGTFGKWLFSVVACLFLLGVTAPRAYTMVKISVAPKVYLIEYVVDLAQGKNPNGCRH